MDVITEADLLERIHAFLKRHAMKPSTFGRNATGEPQFVSSLEGGRSPSLKVANKVVAYMARADEEARLQGKLCAPLELTGGEADVELPFASAPSNRRGGASSSTSSPTSRAPAISTDGGTCPSCSGPDEDGAAPERSAA